MPYARSPLAAARTAAPQYHLPGESRFLTLWLAGAAPAPPPPDLLLRAGVPASEAAGAAHKARKRAFAEFDQRLHHAGGPAYLRVGLVARLVRTELHRAQERQLLGLLAYTVLPNHLHLVIRADPAAAVPVGRWLARFKTRTAQLAHHAMGTAGPFWESAQLDLPVADDAELHRLVAYVRRDAAQAGLVADPDAWPHTWRAADFW